MNLFGDEPVVVEPNSKVADGANSKVDSSKVACDDQVVSRKRLAKGRRDDALSESERERCLKLHNVLQNVPNAIIVELLRVGKPLVYQRDDLLIRQGDPSGAVFFLLSGSVSILVNETLIAVRKAAEIVGEMGALDPGQKRSASVVAREETRVLKVSKKEFGALISREQGNSQLLFNIARITAERLRCRSGLIRVPNVKPIVFIGSSTEAKDVVTEVKAGLEKSLSLVEVVPWTSKLVFQPSASTMESLEKIARKCDFAIMILSPDDVIKFRGERMCSPRDNVIFELGLFMGHLGRLRCFYLVKNAKVPSDIEGDTRLSYQKNFWSRRICVDDAVEKIVAQIKKQGVRK